MTGIEALGYSVSTILLALGLLLVLAEAAIPGAHFIVLGVGMFITGIIGVTTPIGGNIAYLTVTFGVVSFIVYLGYSRLNLYQGDGGPVGSTDSETLVGVHGTVTETVTTTDGKADLEETGFTSVYQARLDNNDQDPIQPGTEVVVTDGRGGNVVTVEPATDES